MTETEGMEILRRRLPEALARGLAALHRRNRRLWALEDAVRATDVDKRVAALKRAIDEANLARHAAVTRIDAAVLVRYRRSARSDERGAVIDSSSVGQLLDRLSILALKRARVVGPTAHALATAQWNHGLDCLDRALAALTAGRWVHHAAGEVKQYGAVRPGRSRRSKRPARAGPAPTAARRRRRRARSS